MPTDEEFQRMADRVIKLEELMTHQQHTLQQLDEVVRNTNLGMEELRRSLRAELDRMKWQFENRSGEDLPHEKPPHY